MKRYLKPVLARGMETDFDTSTVAVHGLTPIRCGAPSTARHSLGWYLVDIRNRGPVSIWRPSFPRRSRDRLIFNTRIPFLVKRHLYIETPWARSVDRWRHALIWNSWYYWDDHCISWKGLFWKMKYFDKMSNIDSNSQIAAWIEKFIFKSFNSGSRWFLKKRGR